MVLQREKPIHIWGWSAPGEKVSVEFHGTSREAAGNSFETAILAVADNVANGYTIGAIVPDGINPSTLKVSVAKLPNLDVQSHPIPLAH